MLMGTLLATFRRAECTGDTAALMTDVSDNAAAVAAVAHADSKLGCFLSHMLSGAASFLHLKIVSFHVCK